MPNVNGHLHCNSFQEMRKLFILALFYLVGLGSVQAQDSCQYLFQSGPRPASGLVNQYNKQLKEKKQYPDVLDTKLLNEIGLVLQQATLYSRKALTKDQKSNAQGLYFIAPIKTLQKRYLYKWQPQTAHERRLRDAGVSSQDMDVVLNREEQGGGRGFYVSTNAVDSQGHGSYLTLYKNRHTLYLLDFNESFELLSAVGDNLALLQSLRKVGFSGILYTNTWISLFHEKHLDTASKIDRDFFSDATVSDLQKKALLQIDSIREQLN